MRRLTPYIITTILLILLSPVTISAQTSLPKHVCDSVCVALRRITLPEVAGSYVKVESIRLKERGKSRVVEVRTSVELAYFPMRPDNITTIYNAVREQLPAKYRNHTILVYANGQLIDKLIPQYYRKGHDERSFTTASRPLIIRQSSIAQPTHGLANRHIALWQSHGRYFNQNRNMWVWQRSRLWETVEDLYTQSYVLPYLVPMLERAGATVLLPRERCVQTTEIIADNDKGIDNTHFKVDNGSEKWRTEGIGFAHLNETYATGENPFDDGTTLVATAVDASKTPSWAHWGGRVEKAGIYSVYVAYTTHKNSVSDARYVVHTSGGDMEFVVNQTMGGSMWVCLGDFYFEEGNHTNLVSLCNISSERGVVVADAVKIGGGMGNIRRNVDISLQQGDEEYESTTSGYPRFTEGSRYWLQWSGFSTDVYAPKQNTDDYKEDYMSRAHWVNALMGGSENLKREKGKGIPIDLALAFHSDAGVRLNDDIIGTLGIYCTKDNKGKFANNTSRLRSRDLTDMVMTQIVEDIRAKYEPCWTRRGMWDRAYYEARIPSCPTMLLELLSHQNFADMRYGLDPSFRFDVSRAVYKGILRYLSSQYKHEYIVQPLPINSFAIDLDDNKAHLCWSPTIDVLEPSATPDYYILYTRIGDGGFDSGQRIDGTSTTLTLDRGVRYSFRITAVNRGGESFDSEILSAYCAKSSRGTVMIINGFDRIAAPISQQGDSIAGFFNHFDSGVAYIKDISFIGEQVVFDRSLSKSENDNHALGTSYSDYETRVIAGNTFDYPALHGRDIAKAGYSYTSSSQQAVTEHRISISNYPIVNIILGKQRATKIGRGTSGYHFEVLPAELQHMLRDYTIDGGALMISGSYLLNDLWHSPIATQDDRDFAERVLKVRFGGGMASRDGKVRTQPSRLSRKKMEFEFNTEPCEEIYPVECPEVVQPADKRAFTILRYSHSQESAAVAYDGAYRSIVMGFPYETITDERQRAKFMESALNYLMDSHVNRVE